VDPHPDDDDDDDDNNNNQFNVFRVLENEISMATYRMLW
jgi:hypothetical protein